MFKIGDRVHLTRQIIDEKENQLVIIREIEENTEEGTKYTVEDLDGTREVIYQPEDDEDKGNYYRELREIESYPLKITLTMDWNFRKRLNYLITMLEQQGENVEVMRQLDEQLLRLIPKYKERAAEEPKGDAEYDPEKKRLKYKE